MNKQVAFFMAGVFLLVSVFAAQQIAAQSGRQPAPLASPAATPDPNAPKMSLDDVIRQVEEYHPKLEGAAVERRGAEAKLLEKQGAFDPAVYLSSDVLRYNSTSSPGSALSAFQNETSVELATRSGMKLFAGSRLNLGRVKSPLSATGRTGEYFAGVAMPLFRDRGVNEKSIAEQQARVGIDIADAEITAVRLDLVRNAGESYWDWVAARQRLDVARNLFEIANVRAGQVAARVKSGDLPPIDSVEASSEVQRRMNDVVKATRDVEKGALKLGLYLWRADGTPDQTPTPDLAPESFSQPNRLSNVIVEEGIKRALDARPELQQLNLERNQSELDAVLARNNRRPRLDLYMGPGIDTGFQGAGATFKFGAAVELPLRTRRADGQFAAAQLKVEKINLEQQIARQAIATQVTDAAQAVNAAHDRYLLVRQELDLARTLEQGERARFAVGDSTLFLVNQRERATAETAARLINIHAEYEQALIAFKIATTRY